MTDTLSTPSLPDDLQAAFDADPDFGAAIQARFGSDDAVTPAATSADATGQGDADDPAGAPAADAVDGAAAPQVDGASTASEPTVLHVPYGDGQTFDLDVDAAQRLLAVGSWAKSLEPHANDIAALEQGTGKVIPNADYEAFTAWQRTRSSTEAGRVAQTDEALQQLRDLDPEAADQLDALRAENARLTAQAPAPADHSQSAFTAQHVEQRQAQFESAVNTWRESRGLTEAQAGDLLHLVVSSGTLAQIVNNNRVFSPSGQLLQDADLSRVADIAMNFALANDPVLYNEVAARSSAAAASLSAADEAVALKKARGASLASTPSASVSLPAKDPRSMSESERVAAMADVIRSS